MTNAERELILDLIAHRISESDFLARFPIDPRSDPSSVTRILEQAYCTQNASDVEFGMYLGFHFNSFSQDSVEILCKLLVEDWHKQHEDIAWILQKLKDPASVGPLYWAANASLPYLAYDDAHALATKAMWALSEINSEDARRKLTLLTQSEIPIIRDNAARLLRRSLERLDR